MANHIQKDMGRLRTDAGLSLIEVTLALGLISFAFIPLMGLLAMGFTSYRSANETNVQAVIIQNIRALSAGLTNAGQLLDDTYYEIDGTLTSSGSSAANYKVSSLPASNTPVTGKDSTTLVNRFSIVRIASQQVVAEGAIHITPR